MRSPNAGFDRAALGWIAIVAFTLLVFATVANAAPPVKPLVISAKPRIVSLIPSLTEDLFAIGAGPQVVGVSQFTDYPPAAARLPEVASFATVDTEKVIQLRPDVIVAIRAQRAQLADLRRAGKRAVFLSDDSYDDIFTDLTELGRLSGHASEAKVLCDDLRARTARLVRSVPAGRRPRAFMVLGVAPIFTAGDRSYIAHLFALAGARNAATGLRDAYGRYSAEALVAAQPDVLIADEASGLAASLNQPPWNALRAVKEKRVYIIRDADLLERPGPRYVEGLRWLIARLH